MTIANQTLQVLDHLLVVLMLVEILHTVRISIHSHTLITEPFLVVGLIASIRRILVITLEASTLTKEGTWSAERASIFRASMIELGLLGVLVLILVFSVTLLRRNALLFQAPVPLRFLRLILVKRRQEPVRILAQHKIGHRNPQLGWIASADPHLSLFPQPVLQIHSV